jgi:hypothetical protein
VRFNFHLQNINIFNTHDVNQFWHLLLPQKTIVFSFPTYLNILPTMLPNDPWFKNFKKKKNNKKKIKNKKKYIYIY